MIAFVVLCIQFFFFFYKQRWKIEYELYTIHQQLYFFAYIISIVTIIKYIDIEFNNQPVCIPFCDDLPDKLDIIQELINPRDVSKEQKVSKIFKGFLVPPSNIWQAATEKDADSKPSNTKILRRARSKEKHPKNAENATDQEYIERYMQDPVSDYASQFTKKQAKFLQLTECVRLKL